MEEHPFPDRSYSDLTNFFIALALVKGQVMLIAGVEHYALGAWLIRAPVVHGL